MKKLKMKIIPLLLMSLLLGGQSALAANEQTEEKTTGIVNASGTVEAVEKTEDGEALIVKVGQYEISDYARGPELIDLVGKKVEVEGELYKYDDGKARLDVIDYTVAE